MFQVLLIVAAVGYILVRRMIGEPVQAKRMLVLPAVLTVIGLTDSGAVLHSPMALVFLVVTGALSLVFGALRGASVRVLERDNVAFVQYTGVTVALWVANLAVKFGANLVLDVIDKNAAVSFGNTLLLTLGAGMLVEGAVVLMRALRTDSQVIWAKGKDGRPHTTSAFLGGLQNRAKGYL